MDLKVPIAKLPDIANKKHWAYLVSCPPLTLDRAEKAGKLEKGTYMNARRKHYTKEQILKWLNVPLPEAAAEAKCTTERRQLSCCFFVVEAL